MTATMIGVGDVMTPKGRMPATQGLALAGLKPLVLAAKEGLALLNGTQFSTAVALAALFESEVVFQTALIVGALTTDAYRGTDTPFDPRIHMLRKHQGQIEAAAALRNLMSGSALRASASRERRSCAGPVLPALPAAGDGGMPRPARVTRPASSIPRRMAYRITRSCSLKMANRSRAATSTPSPLPSLLT